LARRLKKQPTPNEQNGNSLKEQDNSQTIKWRRLEIKFKNKAQEKLWNLYDKNEIVFVSGPAGTGKTYISILKAVSLLSIDDNPYKKIIIVKPVVEADEKLGALPGTLEEKLDPYMYSYLYIFEKLLGPRKLKLLLENGDIKMMALAYLRGINIDESIVIFDESQNSTGKQMRTLLTRIGENTKYFILGDIEQSDRFSDKNVKESGLAIALEKITDIDGIASFKFEVGDIVRNKIIGKILEKLNGYIK